MASTTTVENFSPEHWEWVQNLIRDIERTEQRDEFLKRLYQWDLGVQQFRKVETARVILGDPNERDMHAHAACIHALLAIGHSLILESQEFDKQELNYVRHAHIKAYVDELEQSFREWHHGFTHEEVISAQGKIFGAAA